MNKDETILQIEKKYGASYNPNSELSADEQLLICESYAESEKRSLNKYRNSNESVSVKWNANDTHKRSDNKALTKSKQEAIAELEASNYRTPPRKIAQLLEQLFVEYNSKPDHWLYVAQNWNPRAINRVIKRLIKLHRTGEKTILNPPAYFTMLIKFRKRRRSL